MFVLSLVVLTAVSGCSQMRPSFGVTAPMDGTPIPDRTLLNGITDRAQAIRDTSQPTSAEGLFAQLDRTECEAALPAAELAAGPSLHPDEIYELRVPSVLVLATIGRCEDPKCQWPGHAVIRSTATAFALTEDGLCVTNRHVFSEPEKDEFMVVSTARGVVYSIQEVVAATEHDDVAIFRIDTRGDHFVPVPLRTGAPVGTSVAVISHPERHCYTMTTGAIARRSVRRGDLAGGGHGSRRSPPKATPPEMPIEVPDVERLTQAIEITAEYALGSSGGPVLDDHGNAVGMVCATNTLYAEPEKKQDPQSVIRTCVPAESILRLIRHPE